MSDLSERIAGLSPEEQALLVKLLNKKTRVTSPERVIPQRDKSRPLPLSFAQQRLLFLAQFEGASEAYHIAGGMRLTGRLDRTALRRALDRIVARHEALRTTFSQIDGCPFQIIGLAEQGFLLQEHDFRQSADPSAELRLLAAREATQPFDLEHGPLIRGRLAQMADDEHALLFTMHHIVSDGWSMGILINELCALYQAYHNGQADPLPALPVQYADYAAWQRRYLSGDVLRRQAEYWKKALSGAPALLELPTDRVRPAEQDYAGDAVEIELDADLTRDLKALSRRHGATLFMTLLASWAALLARLSGQNDVVIGTPVANRMRAEIEPLIGFFVNTLAARIDLWGSPTVGELLARVKARTLEAQEHQDIPFEQVVEITQPLRSLAHAPIFQVVFAWQNTPEGTLDLPGLILTPMAAPHVTAQFDLSLSLQEKDQRIVGDLEYATALFDRATVRRYLGHWRTLLKAMVADETEAVDCLPLLEEAERRQILVEWNATDADYPKDRCVHELFEAQVRKNPEAIAVACGEEIISYRELDERSNRLARYLRRVGVGPEVIVAVCLERAVEMVVGLLGVLKSGGAYLPLDSSHPEDRLAAILADAKPRIVLTKEALLRQFASRAVEVVCLDRDAALVAQESDESPSNLATSGNLAYLIYTSGSTGKPKGAMIEHRSLTNAFFAWNQTYGLDSIKSHLQMANVAFDVFTGDLVRALCSGGKLALCPRDLLLCPRDLYELMRVEAVESAEFVPAVLRHLADYLEETGLRLDFMRLLVCGSDAWTAGEYRRFQSLCGRQTRLINSFGITEATIDSSYYENLDDGLLSYQPVPIGRPFANMRVYIMDERLQPLPAGVSGEIYIGGAGVGRGYSHRAELTAERFAPDPYSAEPGGRLYRTGDVGRWRADGTMEFLGRNDSQVKIRGFRIELGEIEARLTGYSGVREAVALAREGGAGGSDWWLTTPAQRSEPRRCARISHPGCPTTWSPRPMCAWSLYH